MRARHAGDRRRQLVIAAALLLAEIERLDRHHARRLRACVGEPATVVGGDYGPDGLAPVAHAGRLTARDNPFLPTAERLGNFEKAATWEANRVANARRAEPLPLCGDVCADGFLGGARTCSRPRGHDGDHNDGPAWWGAASPFDACAETILAGIGIPTIPRTGGDPPMPVLGMRARLALSPGGEPLREVLVTSLGLGLPPADPCAAWVAAVGRYLPVAVYAPDGTFLWRATADPA